jgi:DNA-binding CsgD family transcriptional regulator
MRQLSARQYESLLGLVGTALDCLAEGASPWQFLSSDLTTSLDAALGGVFEIDGSTGVARPLAVWPPWVAGVQLTPAESAAHPLVHHFRAGADAGPRTLDDVTDIHRWRSAPAYAAAREQFCGAGRHMAVPIGRSGGTTRIVAIGRSGRNFTAAEIAVLARMRPLLLKVDAHARTLTTGTTASRAHGLTERESAVLALLADGLPLSTIGRRLGIAPRTVAKHQENIQRKLGTADRLNTVLRAQALSIVRPGPAGQVSRRRGGPWRR